MTNPKTTPLLITQELYEAAKKLLPGLQAARSRAKEVGVGNVLHDFEMANCQSIVSAWEGREESVAPEELYDVAGLRAQLAEAKANNDALVADLENITAKLDKAQATLARRTAMLRDRVSGLHPMDARRKAIEEELAKGDAPAAHPGKAELPRVGNRSCQSCGSRMGEPRQEKDRMVPGWATVWECQKCHWYIAESWAPVSAAQPAPAAPESGKSK
jgi:hypothetical protein